MDLDLTFHSDADSDPDPDPASQIKAKTLKKVPYILACHLQNDGDPELVPDSYYHFDADLDFYLMQMRIRMRIQVTKMLWIHADQDADPQH